MDFFIDFTEVKKLLTFLNTYIFGPILPPLILGAGLFLSLKLGFFHLRHPLLVIKSLGGENKSRASSIRALCLALAGTLGVGNIAGVASAIAMGGAGAVFWMWVSALFSMILKYGESMLGVKYRQRISEGSREYTGGAFVYMKSHGNSVLALIFAILCVVTSISMGSVVQSNAIAVSLEASFNVPSAICGAVLSVLTIFVISSGRGRIAGFTVLAVPVFCLIYILVSLYVIFTNIGQLPGVMYRILSEAFSFESAAGGVMGYSIVRAMRFGVARGILSNEAGSGTSVTAHATSDTNSPCRQGLFGIAEVFIDTIVLCSMTAFVILIADNSVSGEPAMVTAIRAYSKYIGEIAPGFMSVSVVFFAFATIICWSFYGVEAVRFIVSSYNFKFGFEKTKQLYFFVYSISVLLGCVVPGGLMWELSDLSTAVMTIINTSYIIKCTGEIKCETNKFFEVINTKSE